MSGFFATIRALALLAMVALIGYYLGYLKIPWFQKTLSEHDAECVAAAIHSDGRWAGDNELAVRREIGRAVMRHARVHQRNVCDVFRQGLTLVPVGYQRFGNAYFRSVTYVRNSLESTSDSWLADMQLAQSLQKERDTGCATHYLRKQRISDWAAQSGKARAAIRASPELRSVGRAKNEKNQDVGEAEFFCPAVKK